jgi:hypothetical protein
MNWRKLPFVLREVEARCATPFDFAQGERGQNNYNPLQER